jgi:hypothetical protein
MQLPDKTIANLVKYYYSWKKTRSRTSLMDRQARKMAAMREEGGSEVGSELGSNTDSDSEDKVGGVSALVRCIAMSLLLGAHNQFSYFMNDLIFDINICQSKKSPYCGMTYLPPSGLNHAH